MLVNANNFELLPMIDSYDGQITFEVGNIPSECDREDVDVCDYYVVGIRKLKEESVKIKDILSESMLEKLTLFPDSRVELFTPDPESKMEWRTFKFTKAELEFKNPDEELPDGRNGAWFKLDFPEDGYYLVVIKRTRDLNQERIEWFNDNGFKNGKWDPGTFRGVMEVIR